MKHGNATRYVQREMYRAYHTHIIINALLSIELYIFTFEVENAKP